MRSRFYYSLVDRRRSNPDGISVNVRCLDPRLETFKIVPFDGCNWEQHAGKLSHLSREP